MKVLSTLATALFFSYSASAQLKVIGCDVSEAIIPLPANQINLTVPSTPVNSIALGVGVQNYTCNSAGTYTSVGAVAQFFDITCLLASSPPAFSTIQDIVFPIWNATDPSTPLAEAFLLLELAFTNFGLPLDFHLGTHVFQPSPSGSGISPVFDYRAASRTDDPNAFVLAAANGTLAAPTGPQDVAWLSLKNVQGDLGQTVMRVNTIAGQPPSSCTPGSGDISVKYSAQYWFFGGPQSPLVSDTSSVSEWAIPTKENVASGSGQKSSKSEGHFIQNTLASDNEDENTSNFDPHSRAFPFMVALVIINGIFVIGVLAAIFFYISRSRVQTSYVGAGAKNAPKGALEDLERELGPFRPSFKDPYDSPRYSQEEPLRAKA